jgi:hypothetical protein
MSRDVEIKVVRKTRAKWISKKKGDAATSPKVLISLVEMKGFEPSTPALRRR